MVSWRHRRSFRQVQSGVFLKGIEIEANIVSELVVLSDINQIAQEAAQRWVEIAQGAVAERGSFSVALSGGSTPRTLYELLAADPWRSQAPWESTHVFWGDERRVPATDPQSNYRMAREALLEHVSVPSEQIYRMHGEDLLSSAVRDYENKLWRYFKPGHGEWPRFDLILLGLGPDGHTASIFPGTRAVSDLSHLVLAYQVPQLAAERMTLTLPVINHAHHILFLVAGQEKAHVLANVLEGESRPSTYPAQAVRPVDGTLAWLVDQAAAELSQ
jgi:6-phosphogluconolactonase